MKELLEVIARGLVQNPDGVRVEESEPAEDGTVTFMLTRTIKDALSASRAESPSRSAL